MTLEELLEILVCPACRSRLDLVAGVWLCCTNDDCRRKYPIKDDIPVMLVEEGDKWREVSREAIAARRPGDA